ncbi:major facilitator superfamily protein [Burkholderia anthina]|uniref:Major facilitator superfamily protein n=1 Tax=Burkholderia anthina TaxID=179879 RepID=A0A6P2G928_9BURK|nr:major facilitator superfamily protein [Burkholderia anthina]
MPPKTRRLQRIQTLAVAFLVMAGLVNDLDRSTLSIANRSIAHELNLSATRMGLLLSASLAYAFSQLPVGTMPDRFGARVMPGLGRFAWLPGALSERHVLFTEEHILEAGYVGLPFDEHGKWNWKAQMSEGFAWKEQS